MINFRLETKLLAACAPAMSTEATRYYLQGVHIFGRGKNLVYEATDGHMVTRTTSVLDQEDDVSGLNIIVPDKFVKQIASKSFLRGFGVIETDLLDAVFEGQTLSLEMPHGICSNKVIDGTFPDVDLVIPKNVSCADLAFDTIGVNLKYFAKLAQSLKVFLGSTTPAAKVAFSKEDNGPIKMTARSVDSGADWLAVLMPMRF